MTHHARLARTIAGLGLATAALATATGTASAQIPGVDPTTSVVIADSSMMQVAVGAPDVAAGKVGVTLQNNTSTAMTCTGIDGTRAGTVTEAQIVARTVSYYARFPYTADPTINAAITGSSGLPGFAIDLGSLASALPGSVTSLLRPAIGAQGEISQLYTAARLAGHVGTIATVTVPARSGTSLTVALGDPSSGPRADFTAGAVLGCTTGDGQRYVFAGYQNDQTPSLPAGSLGPSTTGRFGS